MKGQNGNTNNKGRIKAKPTQSHSMNTSGKAGFTKQAKALKSTAKKGINKG